MAGIDAGGRTPLWRRPLRIRHPRAARVRGPATRRSSRGAARRLASSVETTNRRRARPRAHRSDLSSLAPEPSRGCSNPCGRDRPAQPAPIDRRSMCRSRRQCLRADAARRRRRHRSLRAALAAPAHRQRPARPLPCLCSIHAPCCQPPRLHDRTVGANVTRVGPLRGRGWQTPAAPPAVIASSRPRGRALCFGRATLSVGLVALAEPGGYLGAHKRSASAEVIGAGDQ
jgi:hypothetical protein